MPAPQDQFGDVLQVKVEVRPAGGVRGAAAAGAQGGHARLKKLLAEAMLDKVVLEDLASKKV